MFNIETLVPIVTWLAITVLAIDFVLVLFIFRRRIARRLYYTKKDAAIKQFSGEIRDFLSGKLSVEDLVATLRSTRSRAGRNAIQELLLGGMTNENRHAVTEALFHLGYVRDWTQEAFGRRRAGQLLRHIVDGFPLAPRRKRRLAPLLRLRIFCVKRALAVTRLGLLDASFSEVFMREALADPSPFVGRANVAAMGHNRKESGITVLLELLQKAADEAIELPVRSIKVALVRFSLDDFSHFIPFLDHESARFRFVMVDSIREICEKTRPQPLSLANFPENVVSWFLHEAVHDESVDVRARSAGVVRHFHSPDAVNALRALLHDENEFVRLHAVRACADPYYSGLAEDLAQRISDARWRVREAAVATLATFGSEGRDQLAEHFLATSDRYASEQISEVMQRSGIIQEMLPALASPNGESHLVTDVCGKMVRLGNTSFLTDVISKDKSPDIRARLMEILVAAPTPYLMATMKTIANTKSDPLNERAHSFLQAQTAPGAAAVAEDSPTARSRAAAAAAAGRDTRA